MKIIKKIIIITICIIIVAIIAIGEYFIFNKKDEYTKIYCGLVIDSFISHGRYYSTCHATIKFDIDGSYRQLNTGYHKYNIGDRFCNKLQWSPILGFTGIAQSWYPKDIINYTMIAGLFNLLIIILSFLGLCIWLVAGW